MTTAAIAALIAGSAAFTTADASPIYLKVAAGQVENAAVSGIDLNGDLAYEGDVGTAVGPVRVEVGVARVSGSFGSFADVNAWDLKATGYLDLPLSDNSGVFLGAGVDRGLDVALEALREAWHEKRMTSDDIWRYAKICRVANVMRPYLDSLT